MQEEVRKAVRSVNKNKVKSLNRQWAAATPNWLAQYSARLVKTAAEQDGTVFSDQVRQAAGLPVRD